MILVTSGEVSVVRAAVVSLQEERDPSWNCIISLVSGWLQTPSYLAQLCQPMIFLFGCLSRFVFPPFKPTLHSYYPNMPIFILIQRLQINFIVWNLHPLSKFIHSDITAWTQYYHRRTLTGKNKSSRMSALGLPNPNREKMEVTGIQYKIRCSKRFFPLNRNSVHIAGLLEYQLWATTVHKSSCLILLYFLL